METFDTIIIGTGCAGFGAAIYSGRFNLKTLILGKIMGGTINTTHSVENYPGFTQIGGMALANKLKEHAMEYDITLKEEKVIKIKKQDTLFHISTKEDNYLTKTIIFCTGTEVRKLNIPGEKEFTGKGVHYCALCDGYFYKNKIVGVVGGSDSAAKEALLLSQYAKKVYIIYRKEKIRAEPINYKKVIENKKIEIITNTNILEIKGDKFVNQIIFDKPYKRKKEFNIDGLFIEIGRLPISGLAKDLGIKTNEKDEIIIDRKSKTNILGLFAAGDVVDTAFKQAITGVAEGVMAAHSAYEHLTHK
ncbi:MAG: FAD-dependent oxidoreductase [Candidatus Woesearchaeota archaeon]|jgi:thioredoxin reductase (NADPH)|nr:FAD-dependent oxidoreductase [Candidatus Woesearchaeota archaeon]|tara:strand:+ start:8483 stop:9394 length:912 start_codon:yes stop_codon:yes gene_type:complete